MTHEQITNAGPSPSSGEQPWRTELGATLRLAWPLALANLLQMLVFAIDVMFVARLGARPLAATSLSVALFGTIMWMFMGGTGMVAALISAALGEGVGVVRKVRRATRMGLWLAVLCGIATMAVCWFGEAIMLATGQQADISAMAGSFLRVLMWASVPMIIVNVLRSYVSALGRPIVATIIIAVEVGVAALGNYAFVFGNLGAPAMGIEGSALAGVITAIVAMVAYVIVIQWDAGLRRYRIFGRLWVFDRASFRLLVITGAPVSLAVLAEGGLFNSAAFMMGRIGATELAGHTIAFQVAALAFQIPFGISQAASIRVGYFYGARDISGIARAGWSAIAVGGAFMLVPAGIMLGAPHLVLAIYIDPAAPKNAALVSFALRFLVVAAAFQLFDGIQAVVLGALRGLQDTKIPMVIAVTGYWLPGLATMIYLGFYTPLQGLGVWIGLLVSLIVVASGLLLRWAWRARLGLIRRPD